ncbi:MAG: hypothetical protein OJF52_004227 [Nitrospira sp.]|nr:MAG: hypothetical protein OJF52_004227 [Nitrospira sp.]
MIFQSTHAGLLTTILRTIQFHDGFTPPGQLVQFFHTGVGTMIA